MDISRDGSQASLKAIHEQLDGKFIEWMEEVSDAQYHGS